MIRLRDTGDVPLDWLMVQLEVKSWHPEDWEDYRELCESVKKWGGQFSILNRIAWEVNNAET